MSTDRHSPKTSGSSTPNAGRQTQTPAEQDLSLVDAVYEVALDPGRYDELVEQWHKELTAQARTGRVAEKPDTSSPEAEQLEDHFERAITILERVQESDWQLSGPKANALPELNINQRGEILSANAGAAALLSAWCGADIAQLDLTSAARESLLTLAQQMSSGNDSDTQPKVLRLNRTGDDRPLVVLLRPLEFNAQPALNLRCAEIIWPDALGPLLAAAFDLTTAECDIARALVAGQTVTEISETRGTSVQTVRTQIKELLSKTGTHSQLELIRMMIGFSMMAQQADARSHSSSIEGAASYASTGEPAQPRTTRSVASQRYSTGISHRSTADDGQVFELIEYGPVDGDPVLVFHDEVIADSFVLSLVKLAPGLRFLVPVRHGYGGSTFDPTLKGERRNARLLADTKTLLDRVAPDANQLPLLAHGNGIFFACEFATAYPGSCGQITAVAASLPRAAAGDDGEHSRYATFVNEMSRLAPSMLRFAVQAGFAMYARIGPVKFLERVYGDSASDLQIIHDPVQRSAVEHGGRLTLAQGYRGFLADEQALSGDWTTAFLNTPVPIRILLGDQDQASRAGRARHLQSQSNNITVIPIADAGFFAAFSAPASVLESLLHTE